MENTATDVNFRFGILKNESWHIEYLLCNKPFALYFKSLTYKSRAAGVIGSLNL